MELTLKYDGPLKSRGNPEHKQEIRRIFHVQLKELWNQKPLSEYHEYLMDQREETTDQLSLITDRRGFRFATLICKKLCFVAEIDITLLRPEPPGQIITNCGDIDNRLKTLFDSLQLPKENQVPQNDVPQTGEDPFFCLLEDDNLITKVSVDTQQLLEPVSDPSHVLLLLKVRARRTRTTFVNLF